MNKKAIIILAAIFVLIVGTLGFIIYLKYYSGGSSSNAGNSAQNGATTTPKTQVAAPGPRKLTEDQVVSPVLFFDGSGVTYFMPSGQLYKASFDASTGTFGLSKKVDIGVEPRPGMVRAIWPAQGISFVAEFSNAGTKNLSWFNLDSGGYVDLPAQVTALDWMPGGNKIMYIWTDKGKSTLNISDPDTKNWTQVAELWETDDTISISPDGRQVAFYRTGNSGPSNKLSLVSSDGKVWKDAAVDGYNWGALWSPDSSKILFAKKEQATLKYQLWVYELATAQSKNLGLFTVPEKAVWSQDSSQVYAAVPTEGMAGSGQPTKDSFFKINVSTLEKREFKGGDADAGNLSLAKDETKLFFRNATDSGFYYIDIR